jgi:hypothetical protein
MTSTVRVFIDGRGVDVPSAVSALEAIRLHDPAMGIEIDVGLRRITDSRGLPLAHDTPVHGGAIYRVVAARHRVPASDD